MKNNFQGVSMLTPLTDEELLQTNGGAWPKWLKGITWGAIASEIIDNWDEIKKALYDGWHFADKK